jgi:hypothetical protein
MEVEDPQDTSVAASALHLPRPSATLRILHDLLLPDARHVARALEHLGLLPPRGLRG